ncbi:HemK methyltransferase family member 1 [Trichoplax sp. H2]|nr:HemK methyltransferase family member 1 [Trichoplax sp. H2]|eukprot:RDD36413.1 HemK methyltransferase family member 1 [Trichoplax sp. H2]
MATSVSRYSTRSTSNLAKNLVSLWTQRLRDAAIPEPRTSTQLIMDYVIRLNQCVSKIEENGNPELTVQQIQLFNKLCSKRLDRMPVQYIIREWDFRYITLKMQPPVFIPRPETEELVDLINLHEFHHKRENESITFLDICCGSGAIGLSLLCENPQATCIAIDKDPNAISLTELNSQRLNLGSRMIVEHLDVMKTEFHHGFGHDEAVDFIVSNPPYIPSKQLASLQEEIISFESSLALDGGCDGLDIVKQILHFARLCLKDKGKIWLEVDINHPEMIEHYLNTHDTDFTYDATFKDYTNRARFCKLEYHKKDKT